MVCGLASAADVTDELTWEGLGLPSSGNNYGNFSGKTFNSAAVYAGNAASNKGNCIQLRSNNNNSGIVTTTSGGNVKKITIKFNSATTKSRTIDVYGKASAYTSASDLYSSNADTQGEKIGSITGSSTDEKELEVTGNYQYIGLRSNKSAVYITSITIVWDSGSQVTVTPPTISGETPFYDQTTVTIIVPDETTVYYTTDGSDPTDGSTKYDVPFTISESLTVKAVAYDNNGNHSNIVSKEFKKNVHLTLTGDGTEENPYTVADVNLMYANDQVPTSEVYVKGIISEIKNFDSKYGQINYYISDDGTKTDQFYIYGGLNKDGEKFTSESDLLVGDKVVVKGTLTTYKETNEMNYGNEIVSLTRTLQAADLSYGETTSFTVNVGEAFTAPTLQNDHGLSPITYETSNAAVATVTEDGIVTVNTTAAGSATITASFAGNATYAPGSASFTVNVVEPITLTGDGTEENPYTVADVTTLYDNNLLPTDEVCVKGTVTRVTNFNSTYGSLRYYISDDGTTDNGEYYIYNGLGLNKAKFTAQTDLTAGDQVVVKGKLTTYNTTREMAQNNYLVSLTHSGSTLTDPALAYATSEVSVNVGETVTNPLTNEHNVTVTYSSDNTAVATVDETTGEVTGVAAGSATITATFAGDETYSASTASYTINVIDPNANTKTATFIFNTDEGLEALGIDKPEASKYTYLDDSKVYTSKDNDEVMLSVTHGSGTHTGVYNSKGATDLRVYKNGGSITLSVPTGYALQSITFTKDGGTTFSDWTADGYATSQTFTATATRRIATITVTYAPATLTSVTLSDAATANNVVGGYSNVTLTRSFAANAWNTLVLPFDLSADQVKEVFGEGVRMANLKNTSADSNGDVTLHFSETDAIEANVPVLVYGAADATAKLIEKVSVLPTATPATTADACSLVGSYDQASLEVGDWFLSTDNKLYKATTTKTIKPLRAVFRPTSSEAKSLRLDIDGDVTAIDAVTSEPVIDANAPLYNLAGQRVGKAYKGVVVQNGRKFINK